jgi:hypothetical protein
MLLEGKEGGRESILESPVSKHTSPYAQDVVSMVGCVEKCHLPQTYSPEERAHLGRAREYAERFREHEDVLQTVRLGHRLATGDSCDTGQEVLARGKWEVRATPLEVVAYYMGNVPYYSARQERGRNKTIAMGERR